jgi:hypothetical protein
MRRSSRVVIVAIALTAVGCRTPHDSYVHGPTAGLGDELRGVPCEASVQEFAVSDDFFRVGVGETFTRPSSYGAPYSVGLRVLSPDSGQRQVLLHVVELRSSRGRRYRSTLDDSLPRLVPMRRLERLAPSAEEYYAKARRTSECSRPRVEAWGYLGLATDLPLDFRGRDTLHVAITVSVATPTDTVRRNLTYRFIPVRRWVFHPLV